MNTVQIIRSDKRSYYLDLGKDDYYVGTDEPEGEYYGKGATRLGLEETPIGNDDRTFHHLFNGFSPDGKEQLRKGSATTRTYHTLKDPQSGSFLRDKDDKLIRLSKKEYEAIKRGTLESSDYKRIHHLKELHNIEDLKSCLHTETSKPVHAYDSCFSAPKDVSLLWAFAPDEQTKQEILTLHKEAVKQGLDYLHDNAFYVRTGSQGTNREKAEGIVSLFHHSTSRSLDPQLHTHCVIHNIGITSDGSTYALDGRPILKAQFHAGALYRKALENGIKETLGLNITHNQHGFTVDVIPDHLRDTFSKRDKEIRSQLKEGMTPEQRHLVRFKTRSTKKEVVREKIEADWKKEAQGFTWKKPRQQQQTKKEYTEKDYKEFYSAVLKDVERKSKFRGNITSEGQIFYSMIQHNKGLFTWEELNKKQTELRSRFFSEVSLPKSPHPTNAHPSPCDPSKDHIRYKFNSEGIKARDYKTTTERLAHVKNTINTTISATKKQNFHLKYALLTVTGKISLDTYLKVTRNENAPKDKYEAMFRAATGKMSNKQAQYYIKKFEREKECREKEKQILAMREKQLATQRKREEKRTQKKESFTQLSYLEQQKERELKEQQKQQNQQKKQHTPSPQPRQNIYERER